MNWILTILTSTLMAVSATAEPLAKMPMSSLEKRLEKIDAQLAQLANYSLGIGIGAIGYRSQAHETAESQEWVEIDFGQAVPLDEVILVPSIRRDTESDFQADAFPSHFRLVAGTDVEHEGQIVAEYTPDDKVLPRIAPFAIPCGGIMASWIRIEADQLSIRAFDQAYVFELAEILAFSGQENIAMKKAVKSSSNNPEKHVAWDEHFLVDGFVPYLMDAAQGKQSVAYVSPPIVEENTFLTIDLGHGYPLSSIHLHAIEQSDTLPQAFAGDFGIPKRMRIEGANLPDFSDTRLLLDLHHKNIYEVGPIMMWPFPESTCRYVRLTIIEPSDTALYGSLPPRFGFAEIELFFKGLNVAFGKPTTTSFKHTSLDRPLANLTDGRNMYGNILPIRDWMTQLALRHDLETERPLVANELNQRYTRQKTNLLRLGWLVALLTVGTISMVLVDRILLQRAVSRTREGIAADLHDELGANLHAIGLLSDLIQRAKESPRKLGALLPHLRALTERSGAAARYCTNMLESKGLYENLVEDMKHTSARIMADLEHTIAFEGEEILHRLKPRKRIDLFLFYKECLINIIRHSSATEASTQLIAGSKELRLIITDNGHGLNEEVPASLKRRARLLGAQVESEHPSNGGTRITLKLKLKKFGVLK